MYLLSKYKYDGIWVIAYRQTEGYFCIGPQTMFLFSICIDNCKSWENKLIMFINIEHLAL